ncbi:MAG TPA: DUF1361 domain-containing protein [Candidatus Saccharimonadales bacterium]|nr:DUF1361 domain-containing protein [Candidatus Saccharimonadales bacterium]
MASITISWRRFILSLGILTAADLILLGLRILVTDSSRYRFIPGNLALAWLSLLTAWLLVRYVKHQAWLSWQGIGLTILWLLFLPNTWYVLTDFIHVVPTGEISQLFDIVLIWLLVFTGFVLGIASLFIVHRQLLARLRLASSWAFIEGAIIISSFAIYLGRDLRWNSWDIIANPAGLLVNVSNQVADPFGSPRALNVTVLFFILINLTYGAFWLSAHQTSRG